MHEISRKLQIHENSVGFEARGADFDLFRYFTLGPMLFPFEDPQSEAWVPFDARRESRTDSQGGAFCGGQGARTSMMETSETGKRTGLHCSGRYTYILSTTMLECKIPKP